MTDDNAWSKRPRIVSVCVDTEGWFDPYARQLVDRIAAAGDRSHFVRCAEDMPNGSVAFYLSCVRLTPPAVLTRNLYNLVVHASALPEGRGFSPVVWQVMERKSRIPLTMIFAAQEADAGDIVMRDEITLNGTELNTEIRDALGGKIQEMCLRCLAAADPPTGTPQTGEPTWYRRRTTADSAIDPERTIADQFDLLRTVDNDRYPAFFDFRGRRYRLLIEPDER